MTKNNLLSVLKAIGGLSENGILLYSVRQKSLEYVNDSLLKLFDISHESFRHQPEFFLNHIVPDDLEFLKLEYERLLKEQRVEDTEFMLKGHQGELKTLSCNCYLLENGKYVAGIFKNISLLREHEDYIINYGAKKNTLLDMVTHNLSGPLMISRNMIESLESVLHDKDLQNVNTHIHLIKENTKHCIDIVNDFLEEEHLVSEQIFTKNKRIELLSKVEVVLERMRKSYPDYIFAVRTSSEAIHMSLDDVKFLQILNNLISNAIKWSPPGSAIEIGMEESEGHVSISVSDKGIGIPDELKPFLFHKSSPASRPGLRGEKSIGMGLYIIKKLVGLMKGSISYRSVENEGSTFTITFPKDDPTNNGR